MRNKLFNTLASSFALIASGFTNAALIDYTSMGTIANYGGNSDFNVTVFGGPETDINLAPHVLSGTGLVNSSDPSDISNAYPTEDIIRFDFFNTGIDSLTVSFNAAGDTVVAFGEVRAFDYDGNTLGIQPWYSGSTNTISFDFSADIASLEVDSNADESWRDSSGNSWWYAVTSLNYTPSDDYEQIPEPSSLAIFALGLIGLASRKFKKNMS